LAQKKKNNLNSPTSNHYIRFTTNSGNESMFSIARRISERMKTRHWLLLILGNLLLIFFLPRSIIYSENKVFAFIFINSQYLIFQPLLIFNALRAFITNHELRVALAIASVFVFIPASMVEQARLEEEIAMSEMHTIAIVTNEKYLDESKKHGWYIQCSYSINGNNYTSEFMDDPQNKYAPGDTLRLVYLEDYPHVHAFKLYHKDYILH
jgi:hypothetical protein